MEKNTEQPALRRAEADEKKRAVRRAMREKKALFLPDAKSRWDRTLCERLLAVPDVAQADCIYAYASLSDEAGTWEFLEHILRSGTRLALPRVTGVEMDFFYVDDLGTLSRRGKFHIPEPSAGCRRAEERRALVIAPGTAFTRDGRRLGKGGGYYDRFLAREPEHLVIGLAYGFQIVEELPVGPWDRSVHMVVTPEAAYRRNAP